MNQEVPFKVVVDSHQQQQQQQQHQITTETTEKKKVILPEELPAKQPGINQLVKNMNKVNSLSCQSIRTRPVFTRQAADPKTPISNNRVQRAKLNLDNARSTKLADSAKIARTIGLTSTSSSSNRIIEKTNRTPFNRNQPISSINSKTIAVSSVGRFNGQQRQPLTNSNGFRAKNNISNAKTPSTPKVFNSKVQNDKKTTSGSRTVDCARTSVRRSIRILQEASRLSPTGETYSQLARIALKRRLFANGTKIPIYNPGPFGRDYSKTDVCKKTQSRLDDKIKRRSRRSFKFAGLSEDDCLILTPSLIRKLITNVKKTPNEETESDKNSDENENDESLIQVHSVKSSSLLKYLLKTPMEKKLLEEASKQINESISFETNKDLANTTQENGEQLKVGETAAPLVEEPKAGEEPVTEPALVAMAVEEPEAIAEQKAKAEVVLESQISSSAPPTTTTATEDELLPEEKNETVPIKMEQVKDEPMKDATEKSLENHQETSISNESKESNEPEEKLVAESVVSEETQQSVKPESQLEPMLESKPMSEPEKINEIETIPNQEQQISEEVEQIKPKEEENSKEIENENEKELELNKQSENNEKSEEVQSELNYLKQMANQDESLVATSEISVQVIESEFETIMEEPKTDEPKKEEPAMKEPLVEEPLLQEPNIVEPKEKLIEQPKIEEPTEQPKSKEPIVEETIEEEYKIEEPKIVEPREQPKPKELIVEEPKIEVIKSKKETTKTNSNESEICSSKNHSEEKENEEATNELTHAKNTNKMDIELAMKKDEFRAEEAVTPKRRGRKPTGKTPKSVKLTNVDQNTESMENRVLTRSQRARLNMQLELNK